MTGSEDNKKEQGLTVETARNGLSGAIPKQPGDTEPLSAGSENSARIREGEDRFNTDSLHSTHEKITERFGVIGHSKHKKNSLPRRLFKDDFLREKDRINNQLTVNKKYYQLLERIVRFHEQSGVLDEGGALRRELGALRTADVIAKIHDTETGVFARGHRLMQEYESYVAERQTEGRKLSYDTDEDEPQSQDRKFRPGSGDSVDVSSLPVCTYEYNEQEEWSSTGSLDAVAGNIPPGLQGLMRPRSYSLGHVDGADHQEQSQRGASLLDGEEGSIRSRTGRFMSAAWNFSANTVTPPTTPTAPTEGKKLKKRCEEVLREARGIYAEQEQYMEKLEKFAEKLNKSIEDAPVQEHWGGYGLAALVLSSVLTGFCAHEIIVDKAWQDIQHLGRHWPQCMTLVCLIALTGMIAHFVFNTRLPVYAQFNQTSSGEDNDKAPGTPPGVPPMPKSSVSKGGVS